MADTETIETREQAIDRVKKDYKEKTGEELPDHVIDNFGYLGLPSIEDRMDIYKLEEKSKKTYSNESDSEALFLGVAWLAGAGIVATYLSGLFFTGWAQLFAGVFLWALLFTGSALAGHYAAEFIRK